MNIPRVIRWGFDPTASKNPCLATERGRTMYGVIRAGHVVDQHFHGRFQAFAREVDANLPKSGEELAALAISHGLRAIGTDRHKGAPDPQWWGELLAALRGDLELRHEWPTVQQGNGHGR